jgi:hypothetical protein
MSTFPYKDDANNIHVESAFTYPGGVCYKCPFCFTNKNGTGEFYSMLTKNGDIATHRINRVHTHGNLHKDRSTGLYIAEKGRSNTDNWVDGPKSPHCINNHRHAERDLNVYVHVTENTRRFVDGLNPYPKNERYKLILMPNFTYPTLKYKDQYPLLLNKGEFTTPDPNVPIIISEPPRIKCTRKGERLISFEEWKNTHIFKTLNCHSISELRQECKSFGLKKYWSLKKMGLIELLFEKEYSFCDDAYVKISQDDPQSGAQ